MEKGGMMRPVDRVPLLVDWRCNRGEPRARLLLLGFRTVHRLRNSEQAVVRVLGRLLSIPFRLFSAWLLGVEIPWNASIGPRLRMFHPQGIVINAGAHVGADVVIRHNVTIGGRRGADDCPVICDGVDIGAGAALIGDIRVGEGARIGLGAVVLSDVPDQASVYGNPAVIKGSA
jgi:serine acetyltransferase